MFVPFSVADLPYRAENVYGDRTGIVDEPDQPAASLGELTYKARLAGYAAPTSVEFRPELARTATRKVQTFKLRAPYWETLAFEGSR